LQLQKQTQQNLSDTESLRQSEGYDLSTAAWPRI
jgi:hypothetical protein